MQTETRTTGNGMVVSVQGRVGVQNASRLARILAEVTERRPPVVTLDLSRVERMDSTGVAVIMHCLRKVQSYGGRLKVSGVSPKLREVFEVVRDKPPQLAVEGRDDRSLVEKLGGRIVGLAQEIAGFHHLVLSSIYWTFVAPLTRKGLRVQSALDQSVQIGVNALPIVALISFLMGLIMAMQSDYQLRQFGASIFVADLVAVALTREIAPLMTAVIVAGRSGSSIAAEIGTMKVTEEIDALRAMGFNPVQFLVAPKLFALGLSVPCLTLFADVIGIFGGLVFAVVGLQIGYGLT